MNPENIIKRLKYFKYRYTTDSFKNEPAETVLKIYLPLFCYLKVSFFERNVKITSRILYGFSFLSLEYNFLIYALALTFLSAYSWPELNTSLYVFLSVILIHFIVCFIRLEALKVIVHRWIEEDSIITN